MPRYLPERVLAATKAPERLRSASGSLVMLAHRAVVVVDRPLLL